MKLTLKGIENKAGFEKAGISLPSYDVRQAKRRAIHEPVWVHFGIGNIFRVFIGGIADDLLEKGLLDRGIICVETFDYEVIDRVYRPYDDLALSVILNPDGTKTKRVIGALAEAVKADCMNDAQWKRLKQVFRSDTLQLVSFTITEKGYNLRTPDGEYLQQVEEDIENGPNHARGAMAILTAMMLTRFHAGARPVALISMDNCARNGKLLKHSVLTIAEEWQKRGYVDGRFEEWLKDETQVAFDSTMIDKITPRPVANIAQEMERAGLEDTMPVMTEKRTFIAPFVNAERPQYLVIEDRFPNGRPPLEEGYGVYMGDYDTVCKSERMKVTACLNPAHTAAGPLGVVLGEEKFADMLHNRPAVLNMARHIVYNEGMPVIEDPGILSPKEFADEVFERFMNPYLGDTNLRLATDASQGFAVRFGETIKSYVSRYGSASSLVGIPLGIAGFFRYMMGVDDQLNAFELAPDPLAEEIHSAMQGVIIGNPDTLANQLRQFLSNSSIFGIDLYRAGLGMKIEDMLREMICGPGATQKTIVKYFAK